MDTGTGGSGSQVSGGFSSISSRTNTGIFIPIGMYPRLSAATRAAGFSGWHPGAPSIPGAYCSCTAVRMPVPELLCPQQLLHRTESKTVSLKDPEYIGGGQLDCPNNFCLDFACDLLGSKRIWTPLIQPDLLGRVLRISIGCSQVKLARHQLR